MRQTAAAARLMDLVVAAVVVFGADDAWRRLDVSDSFFMTLN